MYFYSKNTFETLPDEMILEICRYLHCSHVLYSLFDLNSRLNRTITSYCQHVWFRRASYHQLLYIYQYILPRIGSFVLSITIHPLHQSSFPTSFKSHLSNICPNLKILTLTSWTTENLVKYLFDSISNLIYLEKLVIQELSSSKNLSDKNFIEKIFNLKNNFLNKILFDYDCDSFNFIDYSKNNFISTNIISLTIQLDSLKDLSLLIHYIPNISHLDISLKISSLKSVPFQNSLPLLKQLSIWAIHYYSNFEDIISFLRIVPSIEQFSLTISTRDFNLINGKKILSILPNQLKQFHYTVCYYPYEIHNEFNINIIENLWKSIPIICSINENDKRIFIHTLPYSSSRLTIRSSLAKNFPIKNLDQFYSKIEQIQVYSMTYLSDIFPIISQCRRVREVTLISAIEPIISSVDTKNPNIKVPYLPRLDILTIEGIPYDLHNLKTLLESALNLSVLVIDLDCLLMLLEDEDICLMTYILLHQRILDLCIRIPDKKNSKLTCEQIHTIARILTRVRNLTIDYETSNEDSIDSNLISTILNEFHHLVIFHIYGKISSNLNEINIQQWLIEQNCFRIKSTDIYRIECSSEWFKLWL